MSEKVCKFKRTPKSCSGEGCLKGPIYNFDGIKPPKFCADHKEPGMICVTEKVCENEECTKVPSYGFKDKKTRRCCDNHKLPGMVNLKNKYCEMGDCVKKAKYNYPGELGRRLCMDHKLPGMVDMANPRCQIEGCSHLAAFNYEGEKGRKFCSKHRAKGMVNLKKKSRWQCSILGCHDRSIYNLPDKRVPKFCEKHKSTAMVQVDPDSVQCVYVGCTSQALYKHPSEPGRRFCKDHRVPVILCSHEGCKKPARFNKPGETEMKYCWAHRAPKMVAVKAGRCQSETCTKRALYNYPNEKFMRYCKQHRLPKMVNLGQKKRSSSTKKSVPKTITVEPQAISAQTPAKPTPSGQTPSRIVSERKTPGSSESWKTSSDYPVKTPMVTAKNRSAQYKQAPIAAAIQNAVHYGGNAFTNLARRTPDFVQNEQHGGGVEFEADAQESSYDQEEVGLKTKPCEHATCTTRATFNFAGRKAVRFCSRHKHPSMVCVTRKRCEAEGCLKLPCFNYANNVARRFCASHKLPGMVLKLKSCEAPGCCKQPSYNYLGEKIRRFCNDHKLQGMINLKCKECEADGCDIRAKFNFANTKGKRFCADHAYPGMVNKTVARCRAEGCAEPASYNYPGLVRGGRAYCSDHKMEGMVNLRHPRKIPKPCRAQGCGGIARFDGVGMKGREYCALHTRPASCAIDGCFELRVLEPEEMRYPNYCFIHSCMVEGCVKLAKFDEKGDKVSNPRKSAIAGEDDERVARFCRVHQPKKSRRGVTRRKRCEQEGCKSVALYNFDGEAAGRFCSDHRHTGMVTVVRKRCEGGTEGANCKSTPYFNFPGELKRRFCVWHQLEGMIDLKQGKKRLPPRKFETCKVPECPARAIFATQEDRDKGGVFCIHHRTPEMVNVNKNICQVDGCFKQPTFNFIGEVQGVMCFQHRLPGMAHLTRSAKKFHDPKCGREGCSAFPAFNIRGRRYCASHTPPGGVKHGKCEFPDCERNARFDYPGGDGQRFCVVHRLSWMVFDGSKSSLPLPWTCKEEEEASWEDEKEEEEKEEEEKKGNTVKNLKEAVLVKEEDEEEEIEKKDAKGDKLDGNGICEFTTCKRSARFNHLEKAGQRFCVVHMLPGMVYRQVESVAV